MQPVKLDITAGYRAARRQKRWAVWKWVTLLVIGIGLFAASRIWASGHRLHHYTPVNAQFSIFLQPRGNQWKTLLPLLHAEPLLSGVNMPMLVDQPAHELALHILEGGERALVLRGPIDEAFLTSMRSIGYKTYQPRKTITVISIEDTELVRTRQPFLSRTQRAYIGFVHAGNESTPLFLHTSAITLPTKARHSALATKTLPNASFHLSLKNDSPLFSSFAPLPNAIAPIETANHLEIQGAGDHVALSWLSSVNKTTVLQLLLALNAHHTRRLERSTLPDGTTFSEFITGDPTIEETPLGAGTLISSEPFSAFVLDDSAVITTNTPWLIEEGESIFANSPTQGFIDIPRFFPHTYAESSFLSTYPTGLNTFFGKAILDKQLFSSVIRLNSVDNVDNLD